MTLQKLAQENAKIQITRLVNRTSGSLEQRAADEGAALLGLEQLNHIVCFDMAQLLGDERVGASVSFRNGRPNKKEYRKYTIKGDAIDDLRMMSEVVERWLKTSRRLARFGMLAVIATSTVSKLLDKLKYRINLYLQSCQKRETVFRNGKHPRFGQERAVLVHLEMKRIAS